jgi:hypothetical protein
MAPAPRRADAWHPGVFGGMLVATFVAPIFVPLFFALLARKPRPKHTPPWNQALRLAGDGARHEKATHRRCGRSRSPLARAAAARSGRTTSARRWAGAVPGRRWRRAPGGASRRAWWTLYGQPELDRLVAQALERNRDIEQASRASNRPMRSRARPARRCCRGRSRRRAPARARVSPLTLPPNGATGNRTSSASRRRSRSTSGAAARTREAARAQLLASTYAATRRTDGRRADRRRPGSACVRSTSRWR